MENKKPLNKHIDHILEIGSRIDEVKVSPFLKEKVMHRLFEEKTKEEPQLFAWLSPRLQLASVVCIIALNIFAFTNLDATSYEESISEFAESFGLVSQEETSIFN